MATKIKKGQDVVLSTTETAYILDGDRDAIATAMIYLVSGTVTATVVAGASETPVMDANWTYYSTAGDKIPLDVGPNSTLRMKCQSAGTVRVNW